jgi:Flp pilus assembly protein TadD
VLLKAGKSAEAERVFREDLRRKPRNGRSLFGLMKSLELQGRAAEARLVQSEFDLAWRQATSPLTVDALF